MQNRCQKKDTSKLAIAAQNIFQKELGNKLAALHMSAGSDANLHFQKIPTLVGLGISNAKPHQRVEFSALKATPVRLYLLARLIQEIGKGNIISLKQKRR